MPPLLCLPPNLVDQTFPRSIGELQSVRKALGAIVSLLQEERCGLILTQALRAFILQLEHNFNWDRVREYPEVQIIYHILTQFGLQQHGIVPVDVSHIVQYSCHPLPADCVESEFHLV